jgi:hypothetical protein
VLTLSHDRDAFLALPAEIYAERSVAEKANAALDRKLFADQQRLFIVCDGSRVIARTAARMRDGVGMLGHFEAHDEPEATRLLLSSAAAWLRQQGATDVIGPIDGDTWHRYRVNAGPFELAPFLLEPVNPPHYDALWRSAGATVAERYVSQRIDDVAPLLPRIAPVAKRARERGYRIRPIDPARLAEELAIVWSISREIFAANAWYYDIALDDFLALYAGIERILVRDLVLFAEDADGTPVGFLFAYPDRDARVVNYKTIGVLRAHRGSGAAAALQEAGYRAALAIGAGAANHCLIRAGNRSESMDDGAGRVFRNYYLYRMPL